MGLAPFSTERTPSMSGSKWRWTAGSFLGLFLHGIIVAAPGAVLPQWQAEFGDDLTIGLFYNIFLAGSLVGIGLTSRLAQRHPLYPLAFAAVGVAFLSILFLNFQGILAIAILLGLGDGVLNLQSNSLAGELHPRRRVTLLNWANATFGLGAISAPLLATFLPWRILFILAALLALVSIALAWRVPSVQKFSPKQDKMPWRQATLLLVLVFFYTGLEGVLGTWSGTYLLSVSGNVTLAGTILSLYWGGLTLGRMTLGSWVGRSPVKSLSLLLASGLVVLALTLIPNFAVLFPLAAFFYGPLFATALALLQERCGHVSLGYLFYAAYIGQNSMPALFSLLENPRFLVYGFVSLALLIYLLSLRLRVTWKE
jgi:MFS family permease